MLEFKPITLADRPSIDRFLSLSPSKQLIGCFEAFYLWRDVLRVEWAETEGTALFRVHYEPGNPQFLYPFGGGNPGDAIFRLKKHCHSAGLPLRLAKVREEQLWFLQDFFPGELVASPSRDQAEYLFTADAFRTYTGKSLQPKRNFVNYARSRYNWAYEPVGKHNAEECSAFASRFGGDGSFGDDTAALQCALAGFEDLRMQGGIIRIDGEISALFVCSLLGDGQTAAGLFLRGNHGQKGVIPLLYQEFFRAHPEYAYFNFGEDLGLEGLRKNKLSFQPAKLLELYNVDFH